MSSRELLLTMYNIFVALVAVLVVKATIIVTTAIVNCVAEAVRVSSTREIKVTIFFLLTVTSPVAIRCFAGTVELSKCTGVALLAVAQYLCIAVHPFLFPPGTTFRDHLRKFIVPVVIVTIATVVLFCLGFMPGYPPLGDANLVSSFGCVFVVFFTYLEIGGCLKRNVCSSQWANLPLVVTLIFVPMHPFHPNPVITIMSVVVYGLHPVYAVHVAAVGAAVMASKVVQKVRTMRVKNE
jgi:hypothetical protein